MFTADYYINGTTACQRPCYHETYEVTVSHSVYPNDHKSTTLQQQMGVDADYFS